jgi:hypothetical protein
VNQPFDEKVDAIRSLLPLVWAHLALMREAIKIGQYHTPEFVPGQKPPPVWLTLDCDGQCKRCVWEDECRGDVVEFVKGLLDRKYRIGAIAAALARLRIKAPQLAEEVEVVYVAPGYPVREQEDDWHLRWANAGVRWMARNIRGDVIGLGERRLTQAEQIVRLHEQGYTQRRIAKELRCDRNKVNVTLRALEIRYQGTASAVGGCISCS